MYLCQFGQNPSASSEDNAQKPYSRHSKCCCVLDIRSRKPTSNQLLPSSQQFIYASLVKIHQLVQKRMHGNESRRQHLQDLHQKQYIPDPSGDNINFHQLWVAYTVRVRKPLCKLIMLIFKSFRLNTLCVKRGLNAN